MHTVQEPFPGMASLLALDACTRALRLENLLLIPTGHRMTHRRNDVCQM